MEKIEEHEKLLLKLAELNPRASPRDVKIFVDYYFEYIEAVQNINENGVIVLHPRTGAPIENPYRKIRDNAVNFLLKIEIKNTGGLWGFERQGEEQDKLDLSELDIVF